MRRTHLGVQAAIVLTMVAFVSWPEFRPVRAQSVWRYAPDAVLLARTQDLLNEQIKSGRHILHAARLSGT